MANQSYEVQGTVVNSLKEVAELLGEAKVTKKAIEAGKYEGVFVVTEDQLLDLEHKEQFAKEEAKQETLALTNTEDDEDTMAPEPIDNPDEADEVDEPGEEQLEYPEVGAFKDEKAIKKYIKNLSNAQLTEWVELEGVEYKPNDHESINRMRQAMAIKALHFPDTAPKAGSTKKKSKYGDYTTEQLVEMALDNDVEVRDDKGDPRILRMYTIMALKEAGLLA